MSELPEPLTPPEADLKDFPFTPIYRARLFGSAFHARANDAEWRAGVTLWLKAQDQRPAGSLPDDDVELCRLAELGRDLKAWKKLRAGALHGWLKCSDGRLYNEVVAEVVNGQWREKTEQRQRTAKARIAALEKRHKDAKDQHVKDDIATQIQKLRQELSQTTVTDHVTGSVAVSVTETKRSIREGKGREGKGIESNNLFPEPAGSAPISDNDRLWSDGVAYLAKRTQKSDDAARGIIGRWLKGNSASTVLGAISRAQAEQAVDPIAFVTACLKPGKQASSGDGFVPLGPAGG